MSWRCLSKLYFNQFCFFKLLLFLFIQKISFDLNYDHKTWHTRKGVPWTPVKPCIKYKRSVSETTSNDNMFVGKHLFRIFYFNFFGTEIESSVEQIKCPFSLRCDDHLSYLGIYGTHRQIMAQIKAFQGIKKLDFSFFSFFFLPYLE